MNATDIGDLSNNKYAAIMRELAQGLVGWSGLVLLPFLIYQIVIHEFASFFTIKAFLIIIVAEIIFTLIAYIGNAIFAAIASALILPFVIKNKIELAQNIQNTGLALFGLFLCVAAWFFAGYAVNYAY